MNPVDHQANKHVRVTCHYVRELTSNGVIQPTKLKSEDNLADILTKPLGKILFCKFADMLVLAPKQHVVLMLTAKGKGTFNDKA